MKQVLITVCGRAGSKGFRNKNLKTFCDKPLVYYTLAAAMLFKSNRPDLQVDICLNTDSALLVELVKAKYPQVTYIPREAALSGDTVPKMAVFQQSLREMQQKTSKQYDYLMDLDITSPLRTAQDVQNAFEQKEKRPDLDLVFSVTHSRRNPYFNMVKKVGDHVEKVLSSSFTARQQAPEIYDLNASIYVFEVKFLSNNKSGILWDGKIGVSQMMDTGILDIDSEEDFKLMEVIGSYLYQNNPEFAKVRDTIRM